VRIARLEDTLTGRMYCMGAEKDDTLAGYPSSCQIFSEVVEYLGRVVLIGHSM
jgi:hypothetical protein